MDASPTSLPPAPPRTSRISRLRGAHRPLGRRDVWFAAIAGLWIALDQVSKVIIRESLDPGEHWEVASFFRVSHVANEGAAFGLFGSANGVLAVSAAVAVVVMVLYYLFPPVDHWLTRVGMALLLGGAVGNLLDRLYQGHVTDFINFSHFPAFNVADAGINLGVAAILLYFLLADAKRGAAHH